MNKDILRDEYLINVRVKNRRNANNNTIIVNKKFNSICPKCGCELYIPTKKDLMEKYNLTDRN